MAINTLASVAHAAGFAMVPEDDACATVRDASVTPEASISDGAARWQDLAQPILTNDQAVRPGSIFDWVPNFNWRADGR